MAQLTPEQLRRRDRVEALIRIASPALNAVLAVGDRISKIVEPEDHDYYPVRPGTRAVSPPAAADPATQSRH